MQIGLLQRPGGRDRFGKVGLATNGSAIGSMSAN